MHQYSLNGAYCLRTECRNNVSPSYQPRAADVWSLGIVLINMLVFFYRGFARFTSVLINHRDRLYHYNPWTDTKEGECNSFYLFQQQPVNFFMQRFVGMTRPVAEHLANKVFNVLDDPEDDSERISAAEFGIWAKDLPDLLGEHTPSHRRASSTTSLTHGHRISSSIPLSHRLSARQGSDQEAEEQKEEREFRQAWDKGNGGSHPPSSPNDERLEMLATASRALELDLSRVSRAPSIQSPTGSLTRSRGYPFDPAMYASPVAILDRNPPPVPPLPKVHQQPAKPLAPNFAPVPLPPPSDLTTAPSITKTPSKWKLSFGKSSASALGRVSPVEEASPDAPNATSRIMGLDPTAPPSASAEEWP
jgi:hypothetical protein